MPTAAQVFRDYETDGVPASGPHDPIKSEIRAWGSGLESGELLGSITPTTITSDQNDYSPTGGSDAAIWRLSTDAARNITGMLAATDGIVKAIINVGSNPIVLPNQSASSSAANRFALSANVVLLAGEAALLRYSTISSRWEFLARASQAAGLANIRLAKTANYTVGTLDNSSTIALGGSTFFTLTFSAASGYASNFMALVVNEDPLPSSGGRGKDIAISGGATFRLYPGQCAIVFNSNNTWQVLRERRYRVTTAFTLKVDNSVGQVDTATDGLAASTGAFSTITAAVNRLCNDFEWVGCQPGIQLTSGQTYNENVSLANYLASGLTATQNDAVIIGDPTSFATAANYTINGGSGIAILAVRVSTPWRLLGLTLRGTDSSHGTCIEADFGSVIYVSTNVRFTNFQFGYLAVNAAQVEFLSTYERAGNCAVFGIVSGSGSEAIHQPGNTVTHTGTPACSSAWISVADGASVSYKSITYSGASAGTRWLLDYMSFIDVGAATPGLPADYETAFANCGNSAGGYQSFLPPAAGGTGVGTSTGTGSVVLSASPTFTGTALFASLQTSNQLTVAYNNANATIDSSVGTGFAYFQLVGGTSGGTHRGRFGVENTTGGALFTGSTASAVVLGSVDALPVQIFANNAKVIDIASGGVGTGINVAASTSAILALGAGSSARSEIRLAVGGPPTSPVDGDIWFESNTNTGLKVRIAGVTKSVTVA
jgi:hypothetical protein